MATNKDTTSFDSYIKQVKELTQEMIDEWNRITTNIEEKSNQLIILNKVLEYLDIDTKKQLIAHRPPLEVAVTILATHYMEQVEVSQEVIPQVGIPKPKRKYAKRKVKEVKVKDEKDISDYISFNASHIEQTIENKISDARSDIIAEVQDNYDELQDVLENQKIIQHNLKLIRDCVVAMIFMIAFIAFKLW